MDIEKFQKYVQTLQGELVASTISYVVDDPFLFAKIKQVMDVVTKILPDYKVFFNSYWNIVHNLGFLRGFWY